MDNNVKIYIDLDSLLDIRFSLLLKLDKSLLDSVYIDNSYDNRIIDEFGYLPSRLFKTLYKYKPNDLLDISLFTNITDVLMYEIGFLKQNNQLQQKDITYIDVNINGYRLTTEQQTDIRDALKLILPVDNLEVNVVDINIHTMKVEQIDSEYISMIMYYGMDWLNNKVSTGELVTYNMPLMRLIVPALLDKPVVLKDSDSYVSMFEDLEKQCSYFIKLQFTNVKEFNLRKIID